MEQRTITMLDEEAFLQLEESKNYFEDYVNNLPIEDTKKERLKELVEKYMTSLFVSMKMKEQKKIDAIQHLVSTW